MRIRYTKLTLLLFFFGILLSSASFATPIFSTNYTAPSTGGASGNYYYFVGHNASETFTSTGLMTAEQVLLTLNPNANATTQPLGFTFYLNSIEIGSYTFPLSYDITPAVLDFTFPTLTSASGDWTLAMNVTTPVCGGCGSVRFSSTNPLSIVGAVPEPTTLALMGLGLAGIGWKRRKAA